MVSRVTECLDKLGAFETKLRRKLESAGAPPFIGVLDIDENERARIRDLVRGALDGRIDLLPILFHRVPTVAAWSVSNALTVGYGDEDAAVYKKIEQALGIRLPAFGTSRATLYRLFSRVCDDFGLAIRQDGHDGRMVDAYLVQAGVSRPQVHHVVEAFLRRQRSFGPPQTHSTSLLNGWEDDALDFLQPGVKVARRVLETDNTGYHAAVFARCRTGAGIVTDFETHFHQTYRELQRDPGRHRGRRKDVPPPKVAWLNDSLSLSIPQFEGRFKLRFDGRTLRVRGGAECPLPQPWPDEIMWSAGDAEGAIRVLDERHPVMVFDPDTGRRVADISNTAPELEIDTDSALLVSRSPFSIDGNDAVSQGPSSFVAAVSLRVPSVSLTLADRVCLLRRRPRPRVTIQSGRVAAGRRGDLLCRHAVICVDSGLGLAQRRLVRVEVGGAARVLGLDLDESGRSQFKMTEFDFGDELARIRVGLLPVAAGPAVDDQRSLAELRAWVWPVLESLDAGVLEGTLDSPKGIVWERCRHLLRDPEGPVRLDPKGGYGQARITFETGEGLVEFDIPWAGVLITRISAEGEIQPLAIGSRLVVTAADLDASIRISSPDPQAALFVRGRTEGTPFIRGSRVLAMRDLASPAEDDRVILVDSDGTSLILLRVVQAMAPERFETSKRGGRLMVRIQFPVPIDAVRLALESETGSPDTAEAAITHRPVDAPTPDWLEADIEDDDLRSITMRIDLNAFDDGMVLAQIAARPLQESRFQSLRANNGAIYALALAAHSSEAMQQPNEAPEISTRFLTLSRWIAVKLADSSWEQVSQTLPRRWQEIGTALANSPLGARTLIAAGFAEAPADAPQHWIPQYHPLMVEPGLYQAGADEFRALHQCDVPGTRELALLADLRPAEMPKRMEFAAMAVMGFKNVLQAQAEELPLENFSKELYLRALRQSDVDYSAGLFWRGEDVLGPGHWRAAHQALQDRLDQVDPEDLSPRSRRIADMMRLIRPRRTSATAAFPVPDIGDEREESASQRGKWCSAFLHEFAGACRRRTVPAFVEDRARNMQRTRDALLRDIAFLLRLGPELFAYHMLVSELEAAHGNSDA